MLGTWIDETGNYGINIQKKKETLSFMTSTVKRQASPSTVGIYAIEARLKLAEIAIISSILFNVEAFPDLRVTEMKELESVQLGILTTILEIPRTTPYYALLMEVGWWPMTGRIAYKKLMLYHNIMRSDRRRVLRKLLIAQDKENRETTWLASVRREIRRYRITLDVTSTKKSAWKRQVKKNINEEMEKEVRLKCGELKKARLVKEDKYERKSYLNGQVDLETGKKILRTRMNMSRVPGNYKGTGTGTCHLCREGEGSIEHYFQCRNTNELRKVWEVTVDELGSHDLSKMKDVTRFVEKVEILLNPNINK